MPDRAVEDALARGKVASDHLTECRSALFLPMRLLIMTFGKDHAEASISGVFRSVLADIERKRRGDPGEDAILDHCTEEPKPGAVVIGFPGDRE